MTRRVGVVRFPGTNCEFDTIDAIRMLGGDAEILWHGDPSLKNVDAIVIPGGFAHGDYLRREDKARFTTDIRAVARNASPLPECRRPGGARAGGQGGRG